MRRTTCVSPDEVPSGTSSHRRSRCRGRVRSRSAGWWSGVGAAVVLMALAGCGTNIEALVAQTGNAAAITVLDLVLTNVANSVADAFDQTDRPSTGEAEDDGGGGWLGVVGAGGGDIQNIGPTPFDGFNDGGDGLNGGDGGDESPGAALYAENCASCHGSDGASGFAPDVTGMAADVLSAGLESGSHGSISLTDEEVAELETYLASP